MSTVHAPLLVNPIFDEWSAGVPVTWTQQSTTATTLTQLKESDPRGAGTRTTFAPDQYIFEGKSSLRATLTSAAVANDWVMRQNAASSAGVITAPGEALSWTLAARCSTDDNYLNVQIIGLVSTTDTFYLRPVPGEFDTVGTSLQPYASASFEWSTTSSTLAFLLKDHWIKTSYHVLGFPLQVTSWAIRVANGNAGAQTIDVGKIAAQAIGSYSGGLG